MGIVPWFFATAENVIGTANCYVHNFPSDIILGRFVQVKVDNGNDIVLQFFLQGCLFSDVAVIDKGPV